MRCEHGITPVTDCYVCVSPKRGEEMRDYHELPEAPKLCATCKYQTCTRYHTRGLACTHPDRSTGKRGWAGYPEVAPHGLCSLWERRDDGG